MFFIWIFIILSTALNQIIYHLRAFVVHCQEQFKTQELYCDCACTIQFNSIQFNSIQFNSIQFNSIQFNSIQFNSIQAFIVIEQLYNET